MMRATQLILTGALLCLAPMATSSAQVGGGFDLTWNVEPGGSTVSTGGGFSLVSTVGAADDASLTGAAFNLDGGFAPGICGSHIQAYGSGCAGTGGFVPQFNITGCAAAGYSVSIDITQGIGGGQALILIGVTQVAAPLGGGCTLNVAPILNIIGPFPLGGVGPGNGNLALLTPLPPFAALVGPIMLQTFVIDATAPSGNGYSNTNGLRVNLGG